MGSKILLRNPFCMKILLLRILYRIGLINEKNYLAVMDRVANHRLWFITYTTFGNAELSSHYWMEFLSAYAGNHGLCPWGFISGYFFTIKRTPFLQPYGSCGLEVVRRGQS